MTKLKELENLNQDSYEQRKCWFVIIVLLISKTIIDSNLKK